MDMSVIWCIIIPIVVVIFIILKWVELKVIGRRTGDNSGLGPGWMDRNRHRQREELQRGINEWQRRTDRFMDEHR